MAATPHLRVADVFRAHWADYLQHHEVCTPQHKAIRHLLACRTAALGGHLWRCPDCGLEAVLYNSCRDRHCPTCQGAAREEWLRRRLDELLPVPYFHLVFTLPHDLHALIAYNREALLDLFFHEVNATLQEFARDPQWRLEGQLGFIAVLHTWTQTLIEHNHLHCAVAGGAWRKDTHTWVHLKRNWLFRAQALADRFRNRYLRALRRRLAREQLALPPGDTDWPTVCNRLSEKRWIIYIKRPFAGPQQVLEYLGRYTHKVAISDSRIRAIENGQVTFAYRDRAAGDVVKLMTLSAEAFMGRFLRHILPPGFQKIRFCGWMARNVRTANLRQIRQALEIPPSTRAARIHEPAPRCPKCGAPMRAHPLPEQARAPPQAA